MMDKLSDGTTGFLGELGGSIRDSLSESIKSGISGKIHGAFNPDGGNYNPSGSELGQRAFDYYKKAYPGTNPWEWLGGQAPGTNNNAQTEQQTRSAERLQGKQFAHEGRQLDKQLQTSKDIANIQAESNVISSGISVSAEAIRQGLNALKTGNVETFETTVTKALRKETAEIGQLNAQKEKDLALALRNVALAVFQQNENKIQQAMLRYNRAVDTLGTSDFLTRILGSSSANKLVGGVSTLLLDLREQVIDEAEQIMEQYGSQKGKTENYETPKQKGKLKPRGRL